MKQGITSEKKRLIGSILAKVVAFFLLAAGLLAGAAAATFTAVMAVEEVYDYGDSHFGLEKWAYKEMERQAAVDIYNFYHNKWPEDVQERADFLKDFCNNRNVWVEVYRETSGDAVKAEIILSNYTGMDTPYVYERTFVEYEQMDSLAESDGKTTVGAAKGKKAESVMMEAWYTVKLYVDPDFPMYDEYSILYGRAADSWELKYVFPLVALAGVLVCIFSFIFLMCSAGHKNGKEGIVPGVLTPIHFDILTVAFGLVAVLGGIAGVEAVQGMDDIPSLLCLVMVGTAEVIWCTIYCMDAATRLKLGGWWKYTLIYVTFRLVWRIMRFLMQAVVSIIRGMPLIATTVFTFAGFCIAEFILLMIVGTYDFPIIWFLEKIILFPVVMYIALVCKKLQEGSSALAEGNLNHKLDTSKMLLDFKEHGENLNRIGQGIAKAVEERLKSEHLKTELITNVSHDLKTPLTSIINYADLLGAAAGREEQMSREQVAEYSEVLLRQSKRLKKLLEDLVEASKATTGNLEVNMERCEVGVLLTQAIGEYEFRILEKQLEVITRQPEEPVLILADGRRLWRVFDNLLNNICKYAQEGSRVYLTVKVKESRVEIIFRNMSKYPLDLSGEELEERFVRGDRSRHMEGNGLGLSIAKSLTELQKGTMEIVTDGDLFKVVLGFPVME